MVGGKKKQGSLTFQICIL